MNKRIVGTSLIAASVLTISPVKADFTIGGVTIGIKPRLTGGAMYYDYSQPTAGVDQAELISAAEGLTADIDGILEGFGLEPVPGASSSQSSVEQEQPFEVTTWLPTVGGGATIFLDRFFIDGSAQHAFNSSDSTSQTQDRALASFNQGVGDVGGVPVRFDAGASSFQRLNESFDVDIDRTEWSISAGYAVTDSLSAYAGYKQANTNFKQSGKQGTFTQQTTVSAQAFNPATGAPLQIGGTNISEGSTSVQTGTTSRDIEREFEYDGPFIGAVYGVPISKGFLDGVFAFNLAVAFLDGQVTETQKNFSVNDGPPSDVQTKAVIKGDSTGLTLGGSWTGSTPIEGLSYTLGVDAYKYDFSGDKVELQGQTLPVDTSFDETVVNLRVGATYIF